MASMKKVRSSVSKAVKAPGKKVANNLSKSLLPKKNLNGTPYKKK